MIGPRNTRSWLERLDGIWDQSRFWIAQDLFKTCASIVPVSEKDYCQIGMTAIVMGDVNAVHTLERAHRRHLLAARARNVRSVLLRGGPFARQRSETKSLMTSSFSASCTSRKFMCFRPHSSKCQQMPASQAVHSLGRDSETALQRHCKHTWIPFRVSLMFMTMLVCAVGVNRTVLQRWASALASLDVSYIAAATLPRCRRCRVNGVLLDEHLLVTGLAPLLQT